VRQVDLLQGSAGPEFSLGISSLCLGSGLIVGEMEVLPDAPNALAVLISRANCSGSEGLKIYDNGVPRQVSLSADQASNIHSIAFPETSSILYGMSDSQIFRMSVDQAGVVLNKTTPGLPFMLGQALFDGGRLYSGEKVIDPLKETVISAYENIPLRALVLPDSSISRTFFLVNYSRNSDCITSLVCQILIFDQKNSAFLNSIFVDVSQSDPFTIGSAIKLIRWGEDGLAILMPGSEVVLVRSPLISAH
jgi:hypothetical protein